jgi:tetratricopeptide (TPR) repeat protein
MNKGKTGSVIVGLFLILSPVPAQISFMNEELNSDYYRGLELYEKEKYAVAIHFFDSYIGKSSLGDKANLTEAEFYSSMSALKLFNTDAEFRMRRFIAVHPESPLVNDARLALGDYFYQNKTYRKASSYYETVDRLMLEADRRPEFCFKNGYSHYMSGDKKTALLMFSEIKDIDTDYSPPALYYFSQIAYEDKKYETAYEGFVKLKDDETFGPVVPFYIAQILYMRKDYDEILKIAPELLKSAGTQRAVELYRFIGDAYYNKGNYAQAISYLEKYSAGAKASGREDRYQLGYCYYKTGDYDKAIKILLELTAKSDIISQNIWCLLGDSYLKKGDKTRAQFAFGQGSMLNYDKELKEDALFNYAKLMYETSYSPFGEAIGAFQEYIDLYPGSERIEEVYNYLVATYMQLKNYKAALASLDKIRNKSVSLEEAYQRVAFFRGLELMKNMEIQPAIDVFEKSLKYGKYNRSIRARTIYWRGEAWYRLGDYEKAIADYKEFMGIPGSMQLTEYELVRYNLGYSFYNRKDYTTALNHFKTFEAGYTSQKPEIIVDARNRIADCYYITTNYPLAISYYDRVIDFGKIDADYALYQKGFALGLTNDNRGKVQVLSQLISKYPQSKYVPGAYFERGRANVMLKENSKGEDDFNKIVASFGSSPFVPRAIVQLGLLYFNTGENAKAVEQFRKVIENYKSTPESRYALTGLKNTYIEMNDVESYFAYIKTLDGYGDVNLAEKDSLLYSSGEKLYMTGNCEKATEIFAKYIDEFRNGSFRLNALYYLADCASSKGKKEEAVKYYLEVIKEPNNDFAGPSLQAVASYYYDKEEYRKALGYFEQLESLSEKPDIITAALRGELRSAYQAGDAQKTIAVAGKLISAPNIPEELTREATFMSGKAHYSLNDLDQAIRDFRKVSGEITSSEGAESKYRVAEIQFKKGQVADAEKTIDEFIDKNTPHQYWMARIFILLSDISIKKGDIVQARVTLQSLKENYPVDSDGILDEIRSRLDSIAPVPENRSDTTVARSAIQSPAVK